MTKERRKILFIFVFLNTLLLLSTIVFCAVFKPQDVIENGNRYTCIFQKIFNIYCPGCGGTRSVGYLLSFDFKNAFLFYPPIFVGIFLVLYFDVLLMISFKKSTLSLIGKFNFFEFILIPLSIILTFIVRNLCLYFGFDFIGDILR